MAKMSSRSPYESPNTTTSDVRSDGSITPKARTRVPSGSDVPITASRVKHIVAESKFHDKTLCQLLDAVRLNLIGTEAKKALLLAAKARVNELAELRNQGEVLDSDTFASIADFGSIRTQLLCQQPERSSRSLTSNAREVETPTGNLQRQERLRFASSDFETRVIDLHSAAPGSDPLGDRGDKSDSVTRRANERIRSFSDSLLMKSVYVR